MVRLCWAVNIFADSCRSEVFLWGNIYIYIYITVFFITYLEEKWCTWSDGVILQCLALGKLSAFMVLKLVRWVSKFTIPSLHPGLQSLVKSKFHRLCSLDQLEFLSLTRKEWIDSRGERNPGTLYIDGGKEWDRNIRFLIGPTRFISFNWTLQQKFIANTMHTARTTTMTTWKPNGIELEGHPNI